MSPEVTSIDFRILLTRSSRRHVCYKFSAQSGAKESSSLWPPSALTRPRILLGGLALGLAYAMLLAMSPKNPWRSTLRLQTTWRSKCGKRVCKLKASTTHTKGSGGTIQGIKEAGQMRENAATGKPNGSDYDGIREDQRPTQPTKVGEAFNELKYGTSRGK